MPAKVGSIQALVMSGATLGLGKAFVPNASLADSRAQGREELCKPIAGGFAG